MDLNEYLWRNRITQKDFSKRIKIANHTLSLIVNKKVTPHLSTAIKIVEASEGQIEFRELLKDSDLPKVM